MNDIDDTDLARIQRGDARALEAVYELYGDRVFRLCRGLLGQLADAEDAAQEVLLRVLDKASQFSGRSRFSTWVYRLTVNHCLNHRHQRDRRRHSSADPEALDELPSALASPLEQSSRAEEREALWGWLRRMGAEHRAVLVLREVEGLSYRECADVLDVPMGTVMSRLSRAREQLSRMVESKPTAPGPFHRAANGNAVERTGCGTHGYER